ncbi:MAG: DUF4410 domain-containing protein [Planctomycetes bacterium]|nr:DUF4410 domain-containing protein [Planctomycetota bacterium]
MSKSIIKISVTCILASLCLLLTSGCSSTEKKAKKVQKALVANPSSVKFGNFKRVELKPTTIAKEHANNKANKKSAATIDSMMQDQFRMMFPKAISLKENQSYSKSAQRTLQVEPHIENIRIISGAARFWVGAMAGNSDIILKVTYRDSSTGQVIANPQFSSKGNAWAGGWSMGASDNQVRDNVVREVMGYTQANK